jgi:hypothetical protein
MKKLILAIILLAATFVFAATKPANYAGNWTLDFKQSKNLPKYYDNIKNHKLSITQDEKVLNVGVQISFGQPTPDKMSFVYNLDGTESKTEVQIRNQNGPLMVPATLKADSIENGKLKITISREIPMGETTFKGITVEDWELSADGKTLTIHRADDTPRGKVEMDMIFVKE